MIVHDFHLGCSIALPAKTYSPLPVDSNAKLTGPVAGKFFQAIGRWYAKVVQPLRTLKEQQFSQRQFFN